MAPKLKFFSKDELNSLMKKHQKAIFFLSHFSVENNYTTFAKWTFFLFYFILEECINSPFTICSIWRETLPWQRPNNSLSLLRSNLVDNFVNLILIRFYFLRLLHK